MMESLEKVRINVFWFVGSRDDSSRKYMFFLIMLIGGEVVKGIQIEIYMSDFLFW